MSKKILDIYNNIANSIGWHVDETGFISAMLPGADKGDPVTSGQHRLVMPYPEQLKIHDWSNRYAFHPFLQSVVGGDSPVMEKTRQRATTYMNFVVGFVFMSLAKLANNKKEHAALTPEQAAYLKPFSDADQTLIDHLHSILKLDATHKNHREFVRFSIVKGRTWKGAKRARVASAQFPVYEALSADDFDRNFCGIKMRVKDVRMIRQMYEHIFPGIEEKEEWERGSDNQSVAPSIETLLHVYARTAICVNKVIDDFGDALPGTEYVRIPLDWIDDISDMPSLLPEIRQIPQLNGNAARSRVEGEDEPAKVEFKVEASDTTMVNNYESQPVVQKATAQAQAGPKIVRFGAPLGTKPAAAETVEAKNSTNTAEAPKFKPYVPSNVVQPSDVLMEQRQKILEQQQVARQAQGNPNTGVELPAGSRMIGNVLYVPAPKDASGIMPAGALLKDGVVYMPYNAPVQNPTGTMLGGVNTGMGVNQMQQQQMIQGLLNGTIDPAQVPGIDQATADMLRGNPILIQNFIQTMMGEQAAVANARFAQQQQTVPRYLQQAAAQGHANTMAQQTGLLGAQSVGVVRFGNTGNVGFGMGGGFGRGFN